MNKSTEKFNPMAVRLNLRLSGKTFNHIGFFHSSQPIVRGYWQHKDGKDGGELSIDTELATIEDFNGDWDLPECVKVELAELGITCDFDDDMETTSTKAIRSMNPNMNEYQRRRLVIDTYFPVSDKKQEIQKAEAALKELRAELVVLEKTFDDACKTVKGGK